MTERIAYNEYRNLP